MIFQESFDWIDFTATIIGSFIATLFTILAWYVIEKLKEIREKGKLSKNINKLYNILHQKRLETHTSVEISNIMRYEIGAEIVSKILKLSTFPVQNGYKFEGNLCSLYTDLGQLVNNIRIIKGVGIGSPTYSFSNPNENLPIYEEFMEDFKENCKMNKIKLEEEIV